MVILLDVRARRFVLCLAFDKESEELGRCGDAAATFGRRQRPNFASTLRDVPSTGYFHNRTRCFLRQGFSFIIIIMLIITIFLFGQVGFLTTLGGCIGLIKEKIMMKHISKLYWSV